MSDNICVAETKTYGPPCFLDENNEPKCEYKVIECGIDLTGITRDAKTEKVFQAAKRTGYGDILSDDDIERQVRTELQGVIEPSKENSVIKANAARFKKDAIDLLDKLRQK